MMLTHYVKVVIGKKSHYLEGAKYVRTKNIVFLTGHEVNKQCDPVNSKKDIVHLISVGVESKGPMPLFSPCDGIKIYSCETNRTYCELETTGRIQ